MASHTLGKHSDSGSPTIVHNGPVPAKQTSTASPTKHATAKTTQSVAKAKHVTKAKQTTKANTQTAKAGATAGLPSKVAQALAEHRVLVLYFGAGAADDTLTAGSVRALKASAGKGVAVFLDKLSNLSDYRRVVEGLDVSQAPSIVIVDRNRKAQVLEGYIDAGSLRQAVADVTG
jgi:hypothetical protein